MFCLWLGEGMKKEIFSIIGLIILVGSLIAGTIHLNNQWMIERQKWKPLVKVDKNIPEIITTTLTLFYKSNDNACGLSILAEVSHEDKEGMDIVDSIIVALDKQFLKIGWKEINYTDLPSRRNYALTILHDKRGNITVSISSGGKYYRRVFIDTGVNTIVDDIFTRLFGVEA